MAAKPPQHHHPPPSHLGPTLAPTSFSSRSSLYIDHSPPSSPIDFSPPLIAMVVVAAVAFLFITYSRLISRHLLPPFIRLLRHQRGRRFLPTSDFGSPPPPYYDHSSDGFYVYSPYGLDESIIKNIPLTIYKFPTKLGYVDIDGFNDCAVCLLDFQEGESIRTLPHCCHSFHVECIDMWLRSHATCPLCRAGVFLPPPSSESPMLSPVMAAARIRPSFDEGILLESMFLEPLPEVDNSGEIEEVFSPERRVIQSEDHGSNRRELDFLLKRSYSFGFERSYYPSERMVMEAATTPYHHHRHRRSFFWTKRPSSTRVFSLRRTMKSPAFFRRKGYFPVWESSSESLRRMKGAMTSSPMFGRAAAAAGMST